MSELTPEARLERAKRTIAQGIDELVDAKLAMGAAASEWVSQHNSPLGKKKHLRYARLGKFPSKKDGYHVLVRRADLNAFLDAEALSRGDKVKDTNDVSELVDHILTRGARKK